MKMYTQKEMDAAVAQALALRGDRPPRRVHPWLVLEQMMAGESVADIAKALGCGTAAIYNALRRAGIPSCHQKILKAKADGTLPKPPIAQQEKV